MTRADDTPQRDPQADQRPRKAIWGWVIYDWANSAFAATVMTVFFPILYKQYWSQGVDVNVSTFHIGLGNSVASLMVALMAPFLGAVADNSGRRKGLLFTFAYLGVLMTASLALIPQQHWLVALMVYAIGVVGWSGANVFYDGSLPHVAPARQLDRVSSLGYALGYLGGGLLLALNIVMTLKPHLFGLSDATQAVKAAFVSVALWWGGFCIFTVAWVPPDPRSANASVARQIRDGWQQFYSTLRHIRQLKTVFTFLLAYWCYIDGVHTIIRMAVDFGMSIGFHRNDLIKAVLITQFIGFPSAIMFGRLGTRWGAQRAIYLALGVYMAATVWGAFMSRPWEFYTLAAVIGLVQGGIQALSRSYYARLIPLERSAEFYGFYNMMGKFAAIMGPLLMGITGLIAKRILLPPAATEAQIRAAGLVATRTSIISILLLFAAGAVLFYFVDEGQAAAERRQLKSGP